MNNMMKSFISKIDRFIIHVEVNGYVPWHYKNIDGTHIWHAGDISSIDELIGIFNNENINLENYKIREFLLNQESNFSCIVLSKDFLFSSVDRIRSYPIFYSQNGQHFYISNNARLVKSRAGISKTNHPGLIEFSMSGYVTGRETIFENLYQLQAGEYILFNGKNLYRDRYFRYLPREDTATSQTDDINSLDELVNQIFDKIITKNRDAQIWVPLSAGLDSRLVLAKLKEHGCKNLFSFSYGVKGNIEAKVAKRIANKINVPWYFMGGKLSESKELFDSSIRREYSEGSDGLCTIPKYLDFQAIYNLKESGLIDKDAVIINGQSGDFITGNHISSDIKDARDPHAVFEYIIKKHFSLWNNLLTDDNIGLIKERFDNYLNELPSSCSNDYPGIYESWEWQERQCKGIVNSQRVYEYFGLNWELPLWDKKIMDFYNKQSEYNRFGQYLYKKYLKNKNPANVYDVLNYKRTSWPDINKWVIFIGICIKYILGEEAKINFYKKMFFYSNYQNQYELFGKKYYKEHYLNARGVVSFAVKNWLKENNLIEALKYK